MPWSPHQLRYLDEVEFRSARGGYQPDDVERFRLRALTAMRKGLPMPDLDAMALRRTAGMGLDARQVDGLRTVIGVWVDTTPIEDPEAAVRREREEEVAALAASSENPRWSHEQMDRVREKRFTLVGRHHTAYDEHDVDDFLDSVVVAMRRGVELPDPQYAKFSSAGMRRGYDPREVDEFLDEITHMRPEG